MHMNQKVKCLYRVEFSMKNDCEVDVITARIIAGIVFALPNNESGLEARINAVDECEGAEFSISFRSALAPYQIIDNVRSVMEDWKDVLFYADIQYQWPYDIVPDRTVLWADGKRIDYMGRIEWVEQA